jgi:hypothetical protein
MLDKLRRWRDAYAAERAEARKLLDLFGVQGAWDLMVEAMKESSRRRDYDGNARFTRIRSEIDAIATVRADPSRSLAMTRALQPLAIDGPVDAKILAPAAAMSVMFCLGTWQTLAAAWRALASLF